MQKTREAIFDSNNKLIGSRFLIDGKPVPEGFKYCNACSSVLPLSAFSNRGNSCAECAKKRAREHHRKAMQNPEWVKKRRKLVNDLGFARKEEAIKIKGGKCEDCGGIFHQCQYDFHHLNPDEKEYNLGNILKRKDFNKVIEELNKCVLLCSNCHRMRHYMEKYARPS